MNLHVSRALYSFALITLAASSTAFAVEPKVLAGEPNLSSRTIHYHQQDIVTIYAERGMTTTIILPKQERIVDAQCGNNDAWRVQTNGNLAFVTPLDEKSLGEKTNFNLVNQSGNIYSFYVVEVSKTPGAHADLKILVEPSDQSLINAMGAPPRFIEADQVDTKIEQYKKQAEDAQARADAETTKARQDAQRDRDKLVSQIPTLVVHDYGPIDSRAPFNVSAIYHTDKETIIEAEPQEPGAVYEFKDGKPALVDFTYNKGRYVIPKVVDQGYIEIGKSKFKFNRKG